MDEPSHPSPRAYVCLGSNLGDRAGFLLLGVRGMLHAGLPVTRLSSVYETAPVDVTDQPAFLNMVAELAGSALPAPEQLLARLLRVEYALGRRRDAERLRGPRTLDLDLILYGRERRATDFLTLPHPRLHLRRFALTPLVELAPELAHPLLGQTFSQLLDALDDDDPAARVRLWQPGG